MDSVWIRSVLNIDKLINVEYKKIYIRRSDKVGDLSLSVQIYYDFNIGIFYRDGKSIIFRISRTFARSVRFEFILMINKNFT